MSRTSFSETRWDCNRLTRKRLTLLYATKCSDHVRVYTSKIASGIGMPSIKGFNLLLYYYIFTTTTLLRAHLSDDPFAIMAFSFLSRITTSRFTCAFRGIPHVLLLENSSFSFGKNMSLPQICRIAFTDLNSHWIKGALAFVCFSFFFFFYFFR